MSKNFTFVFYNNDTRLFTELTCPITSDPNLLNSDVLDGFCKSIENEYGLHDVAYHEPEYLGFFSDEITPENYHIVFNKWLEFFKSNGINSIGNVEVSEEYNDDDEE